MSLVKKIPFIGVAGGLAIFIVGLNQDNNALVIVGIALIALAIVRVVIKT